MTDDRFSEDEIRAVFERASAMQGRAAAPDDGLTVAEMAEIGEASGIPRALVEAAAREVRLGAPEAARTNLGPIPVGVRQTAFLDAAPTDALWERLVADARRTFEARGKIDTLGGLREWRNGNLQMTLEPAGAGSRLHIQSSRKENALGFLGGAATQFLAGLFVFVTASGNGMLDPTAWAIIALFAGLGVVFGAWAWIGQQRWTDTRESQMAALTERASALTSVPVDARLDAAPASAPLLDLDDLVDDAVSTEAPRRRSRS